MGKGIKYDSGKPDLVGLLSSPEDVLYALEKLGLVIEFGRRKYSGDNWSKVPNASRRYKAAVLRHIAACCRDGDLAVDAESGLPHLAHCLVSGLFVLSMALSAERNSSKAESYGQVRTSKTTKRTSRKHRTNRSSKRSDP